MTPEMKTPTAGDEDGGEEESQHHGRGRERSRQSKERDFGRSKAVSRR